MGFHKLVRSRQVEIIPRYGFDASEEGVEEMLRSFRELQGDPDIYINEAGRSKVYISYTIMVF